MDLNQTQALDILLNTHGLPQEDCLDLKELRPAYQTNVLQ